MKSSDVDFYPDPLRTMASTLFSPAIILPIEDNKLWETISEAMKLKDQNYSPEEILEKAFGINEDRFEPEMVYCHFFN